MSRTAVPAESGTSRLGSWCASRRGRTFFAALPLLLTAVLFALTAVLFAGPSVAEKVARVIDGDTIVLENGTKIRYIGVDTPETVHPSKPVQFMGKEASEYNRKLVEGNNVRLEYDVERTDKYGRTLAYVYLDTVFVNAELLRQGYAQVLTIPPDVRYTDLFLACQREAREAGRGLWNEAAARSWTSTQPVTDTANYYITKTGSKYHRGGCRYLSKSAFEITEEDAVARGYGPCSVCIGAASGSGGSSYYTTPTTSSPGRCQAITKKGTQCKRNATPGSKYCWQHGG